MKYVWMCGSEIPDYVIVQNEQHIIAGSSSRSSPAARGTPLCSVSRGR